jgi:hypothetical protein
MTIQGRRYVCKTAKLEQRIISERLYILLSQQRICVYYFVLNVQWNSMLDESLNDFEVAIKSSIVQGSLVTLPSHIINIL